jgi:regulator of protease activity HflC (stomatin/prohibitin superfamily)
MDIASIFKLIAFLLWAGVIGLLLVVVRRTSRGQATRGLTTGLLVTLLVAVVVTVLSLGIIFVQPEQRGVVISALRDEGYRPDALQPGLSFVVPLFENVTRYSIARKTYTMSSVAQEGQTPGDDSVRARTKDGQEVFIDASIFYAIDPAKVVELHINWQGRFEEEVVRPLARGIIRDAASQYGVEEIVSSKRVELEQMITAELEKKHAENDLQLTDFVLRDIHFSDEYAAAVEQKQIAEQQAQQARFVVEQRKQEAEQARQTAEGRADSVVIDARGTAEGRVIQAEAEARALELVAAVLQANPDLLTYQYITKLSPNVQVMFLPSDAPFIFPLPQTVPETTTTPPQ